MESATPGTAPAAASRVRCVVKQHQVRRFARHVGAALTHGDAYVGALERRRVLDAISSHGGDAGNPLRFIELKVVARGGIEPPTRGFSVPGRKLEYQLHQLVRSGARCVECPTMQNRSGLIHAKLPQRNAQLTTSCAGSNHGQDFTIP